MYNQSGDFFHEYFCLHFPYRPPMSSDVLATVNLPSIRELGLDRSWRYESPPPDAAGAFSLDSHLFAHRAGTVNDRVESTGLSIHPPPRDIRSNSSLSAFATSSDAPPSTSHSPKRAESPTSRSHRQRRSSSDPNPALIYSLDVLRLDPCKSSLVHLSSSMTFKNGADETGRPKINGDFSPRFQTALPTTGPRFVCRRNRSRPVTAPWTYPFPTHSSLTRMSVLVEDMNYALDNFNQTSEKGNNRMKHVCPICLMPFNRPSSLHTHLNSHTGATPFCCPYPDCGRKFSVKSNMLRHHRAHSSGATGLLSRTKRRHQPSGFVVVDSTIFEKSTRDLSAESSPSPPSSRAVSPFALEGRGLGGPQLRQVFSWGPDCMVGDQGAEGLL